MYDIGILTFGISNMVSDGRSVVLEFTIDGYTKAGGRYDKVEYIVVVGLEDGKVKNVREYMDALKAVSAHALED